MAVLHCMLLSAVIAFVGACAHQHAWVRQPHRGQRRRALLADVSLNDTDIANFNFSGIVLVKDAGKKGSEAPPKLQLPLLSSGALLEPPTHEYIAMCLVTSESGEEVREWIDHYLRLGVRKFYVFDSNNGTALPAIVDLQKLAVVDYQAVPDKHKPWRQFHVYELCLQRHRQKHQWIAFFDSDEFLMIKNASVRDLPTILKPFEVYGGVSVNWRVFGTSGHLQNPNGSVLHNYVQCTEASYPMNDHVKTITNARYVVSHGSNPHVFVYREGYFAVNEHMQRIDTGKGTARGALTIGARSADTLELNHYTSKSINHCYRKVMRGSINKTPYKTMAFYRELDASCTAVCNDSDAFMANRMLPALGRQNARVQA